MVDQIHEKNRKIQNSSELSPNVNSLDIAIKTCVILRTQKDCYSPHSPLRSGHFVLFSHFLHLISHFFTCLHVLISSSSLLIDFFSRFQSIFFLISYCSVTSRFCFKRVSTCCDSVLFSASRSPRQVLLHLDCPRKGRGVKKMVCLPSLLSRPPAMSPGLRIGVTSKEHPRWNRNAFHVYGMAR